MNIRIADDNDKQLVFALRTEVFVGEQNVPPELELDFEDEHALHIIADENGIALGCARVLFSGKEAHIGRLAVKKSHRGNGIGAKVCRFIIDYCKANGYTRIWLNSQLHAVGFYEKLGFKGQGNTFFEAGIEHIMMEIFINEARSSDDTAKLQALLDKTGIVRIERSGTYYIDKTLIIHSNTRLVLAPGVKLIAAPNSRCALIENEFFAGGGRDENISIVGGIWDGNCDAMGLDGFYEAEHRLDDPYSPDLFKGKLIRFAHVDNIALEKMTVKDPVSYGIQIADTVGFITRDIRFDYNCHFGTTDGVHINGPASNGVIENLYGTTNDDMVSLTVVDERHAEVTRGDIANVEIKNISAKNGYSGIRLLAAEGYTMRCIHINGVYGDYRHNAIIISNHHVPPGTVSWFDDIAIEQVHSHKSWLPLPEGCFTMWEEDAIETLPIIWLDKDITVGRLTLRDISRHEIAKTNAPLVRIEKPVHINRLYAENVAQSLADGVNAPLFECFGTVDEQAGQEF